MSGSLTSSFVKERVPKCPHHQIPCVVKTGTKANETQGKSFFLCNYPKERCSFNKSAADFEATMCPAHKHTVELKAFAKKDGTLRCYYRCNFGKEKGVTWCGHTLLKSTSTSAFKDITNIHRDGSVTKSKDIEVLKAKNPSLTNENNRLKSKVFNIPLNAQVEPTSNNTISKNGEVLAHANTSAKESLKPSVSAVSASEDSSENTSSTNAFTSNDNHFKKPHNNVDLTAEKNRTSDQNVGASNNIIEIESSDEEEATQQTELILSVEEWKARIASQERLLARIGPSSVDGGKKIEKNVQHLKNKLHETRKRQESITAFLPKMPDNAQQHTTKYTDPLPQMSAFQRAPLISGRMTQSKINEVGRITKEAIEHLHKSLDTCPAADTEAEDPKGLKVMLMTHQKQAMAWLLWRERQMPSGGILADDMGLGKTLTMISLSLKSLQDGRSKIKQCPEGSKLLFSCSTLIICPASLLHQWHKEIEKRVDRSQLKVAIYHGPNREKRINKLAAYDIVLTTYAIVSIEGKPFIENEKPKKAELSEWVDSTKPPRQSEGPIFKIFWRRIVLDEGHTIKNHKAGMSIATCSLEAESRWIVTGTPIQNKTLDLYSLIKFLRVSPFDEYKVWQREVDNKSISGTKRLNSLVSSFLLRRTKNQIDKKTGKPLVSLPSRTAILHKITLSKDESLVYDIIQKFSKNMFTQFLDNRKDAQPRNNRTTIKQTEMPQEVLGMTVEEALTMFGLRGVSAMNSGCLLVLVLRLRQCCGHLSLMCEPIDEEIRKREGIEVPFDEQFANMSVCQEEDSSRPQELLPSFSSTKITALTNCLKDLKESSKGKAKSVVVSQWTRMLDIVATHLKRNGFKMEHINGSVNVKKRSDIVERFNNEVEPQVLLVSLKAGGVGLNLIGGSHLFLLDQHWNPALEDQACDRVYRVGQKNDVVIHRFLCVDTVEERIVKLQEQKKSIANSVLYGGKSQKLTLDDLKMLFGVSR